MLSSLMDVGTLPERARAAAAAEEEEEANSASSPSSRQRLLVREGSVKVRRRNSGGNLSEESPGVPSLAPALLKPAKFPVLLLLLRAAIIAL
ncbi:unnamed protein product [Ectocarpus fasciculatus]